MDCSTNLFNSVLSYTTRRFPIISPKAFPRMTNPPNVYSPEDRINRNIFFDNPRKHLLKYEILLFANFIRYYKFGITMVGPIAFKSARSAQ